MIIRLLIIIIAIFAVYYLSRRILSGPSNGSGKSTGMRRSKVVKCGYCQVYIAEEDAVGKPGDFYCSVEHKHRAQSDEPK